MTYDGSDVLKIYSKFGWPLKHRQKPTGKYLALLGLGSNIQPENKRLITTISRWIKDPRVQVLATSPLVINKPFGYLNQRNFTNTVALISTNLSPMQLLYWAQHEEQIAHRKRSFKNDPRTLDVDLLFHSAKCRQSNKLRLPHPGVYERLSVCIPLSFILSQRVW